MPDVDLSFVSNLRIVLFQRIFMRNYILFVLCVLLTATMNNFSQERKVVVEDSKKTVKDSLKNFKSPFRYVIVYGASDLEKYVNNNKDFLLLEVLMEDKDFTEENLKVLFILLGNRFKDVGLSINVYTSLEVINTPEENDHANLKGPALNYANYRYALYNRYKNGKEWFVYGIPNLIRNKMISIR